VDEAFEQPAVEQGFLLLLLELVLIASEIGRVPINRWEES